MAFTWRSGLPAPPRATCSSSCWALGTLLCASTNSARSFNLGDCAPFSRFSSSGMARSESDCMRPLMAISLRSSSDSLSGDTFWPAACLTSTSSALASSSQRLPAYDLRSSAMAATASSWRPSLLSVYAFQ